MSIYYRTKSCIIKSHTKYYNVSTNYLLMSAHDSLFLFNMDVILNKYLCENCFLITKELK